MNKTLFIALSYSFLAIVVGLCYFARMDMIEYERRSIAERTKALFSASEICGGTMHDFSIDIAKNEISATCGKK